MNFAVLESCVVYQSLLCLSILDSCLAYLSLIRASSTNPWSMTIAMTISSLEKDFFLLTFLLSRCRVKMSNSSSRQNIPNIFVFLSIKTEPWPMGRSPPSHLPPAPAPTPALTTPSPLWNSKWRWRKVEAREAWMKCRKEMGDLFLVGTSFKYPVLGIVLA